MGKPQQPELGRSGHTPVTEGQHNRPGHHPDAEQDKPDLERFRTRLTGDPGDD